MVAIAAKVEEHEQRLNKIEPAVFGVPECPDTGLVDRMKKAEDENDTIRQWIAEQRGMNKILAAIATILGGGLVTVIVALLTK